MAGWLALGLSFAASLPAARAADTVGGSLALVSDYFVRGITRTNDLEALQLDLHYVDTQGLILGVFTSNTQIDPYERRDAEINGYLGFAWSGEGNWHGRILGGYYVYPWSPEGSRYNYGELSVDVGFQDWLDVGLSYSPDAPRYSRRGLAGYSAESAELNLQRPVFRKLQATAGVGYYEMSGPGGTGYAYWSVGAAYDWAPVVLAVSYVDTTAGAKRLFYDNAATGRFTGTIIWRF
jgi:uncharacterized protein (TIGR02001 family)